MRLSVCLSACLSACLDGLSDCYENAMQEDTVRLCDTSVP